MIMTNNEIFLIMAQNASGTVGDDLALNNGLTLMMYVHEHPHDFITDYVREFITAFLGKDYIEMMTIISHVAKHLAEERELIEEME